MLNEPQLAEINEDEHLPATRGDLSALRMQIAGLEARVLRVLGQQEILPEQVAQTRDDILGRNTDS